MIVRSRPLGIEATIGPAPDSPLPIRTNSEILLLPFLQLEAAETWLVPGLRHDSGIDHLVTEVAYDERLLVLFAAGDVVNRCAFHVVGAVGRLGEDDEKDQETSNSGGC